MPKEIKPENLQECGHYKAVGEKNGNIVNLPVKVLKISKDWITVKTERENIPAHWNQEVDLPTETVKFFKI